MPSAFVRYSLAVILTKDTWDFTLLTTPEHKSSGLKTWWLFEFTVIAILIKWVWFNNTSTQKEHLPVYNLPRKTQTPIPIITCLSYPQCSILLRITVSACEDGPWSNNMSLWKARKLDSPLINKRLELFWSSNTFLQFVVEQKLISDH